MNYFDLNTMDNNDSFPAIDQFDWRYAESPDIPEPVYIGASVYMVIIGFFGTVSNGGVLLAFCRGSSELRSPFNLVLINLVFCEFVVSVYGIPVDLTCITLRGYRLGFSTCIATGFILTLAGMTSLYTLMGLSVERWLIITRPGKFSLNSYTTTSIIMLSAWALGLLSSAPPLFGWAYFAPETSGMSCAPAWEDPANISYTWYLMILGFIVPLVIILYTSLNVIYNLHRHSKAFVSSSAKSNSKQKERRASLMVLLMIMAFLVSWMPYATICFIKMAGLPVTPTMSAIPLLFAKSSICWNPIIYVILNDQFRNALIPGASRSNVTKMHTTASRLRPSRARSSSHEDKPINNDPGVSPPRTPGCSFLTVPNQEFHSLTTIHDDGTLDESSSSGRKQSGVVLKASPSRRQVKAVIFERGEDGEPTVTVIMTRDSIGSIGSGKSESSSRLVTKMFKNKATSVTFEVKNVEQNGIEEGQSKAEAKS